MLLDRPKCPQGCEALWQIFRELHASRGNSGFGPMRISFAEIDAFQRVTGIWLRPWEIDALRRIDRIFMDDWQSRQKKTS